MISCDLFFFRFKNTWQLLFQSWESCTMKLWKIISLKLPIFSQCVPKKGVWRLLEAFQLAEVGWVLAPTSSPAQITVFCDWHRSAGHTHPSPGSEKNKTKYSRLHLSDAVCLERAESQKESLSIYYFSCFKRIFLFNLRCLENPFLPRQYGVRTSIILTAPHPRRM